MEDEIVSISALSGQLNAANMQLNSANMQLNATNAQCNILNQCVHEYLDAVIGGRAREILLENKNNILEAKLNFEIEKAVGFEIKIKQLESQLEEKSKTEEIKPS